MSEKELKIVLKTIRKFRAAYPKYMFPDKGKTPDAIAAKAIRFACDRIKEDIIDALNNLTR